jgi:hypothetical protein
MTTTETKSETETVRIDVFRCWDNAGRKIWCGVDVVSDHEYPEAIGAVVGELLNEEFTNTGLPELPIFTNIEEGEPDMGGCRSYTATVGATVALVAAEVEPVGNPPFGWGYPVEVVRVDLYRSDTPPPSLGGIRRLVLRGGGSPLWRVDA